MFWDIFLELCERQGVKPHTVAKSLGFSNATATNWKQGSIPSAVSLKKIADLFGVSTDYLLGNRKKPRKPC